MSKYNFDRILSMDDARKHLGMDEYLTNNTEFFIVEVFVNKQSVARAIKFGIYMLKRGFSKSFFAN